MQTNSADVTNVTEYLRSMTEMRRSLSAHPRPWPYMCVEDYVLQHGHEYTGRSLPEGFEFGAPKQCFANSLRLARRRKSLLYCEGYGVTARVGIPLHHAWCVDDAGNVYDTTWEDGVAYVGVTFDTRYVSETAKRTGYHSVLDNWTEGYPLLTGAVGSEVRRERRTP